MLGDLAPRLRERRWFVQWYADAAQLPDVAAWHEGLGLTVVLDHLAGLHDGLSPDAPAWAALERLAAAGGWVKLSGWYRLRADAPWRGLHGHIERIATLFGERLLWGSDWPHTGRPDAQRPRYAALWQPVLDVLGAEQAQSILTRSPLLLAG